MGKIQEFNGDDYVDITLKDNQISDLDRILTFIGSHKKIYLFGNGNCGKGFNEYLKIGNVVKINGFLTSDNWQDFLNVYQSGIDGIVLTLSSDYYAEVLPLIWNTIKLEDILFLNENSKRIFIQSFSDEYIKKHFWLTLPLAKHCNVNCASCNMFSPLCEREFYSLESVKKDLLKFKEMDFYLEKINVSGGEPFLNPEAVDILQCIRDMFPDVRIDVYTNGIPFMSFTEEQLEGLRLSGVNIQITEYEVSIHKMQDIYDKLDQAELSYKVDVYDSVKKFYIKPIDFRGNVNEYDYIDCQYYTFCFSLFLFNGKAYKCPMTMNVDAINNYSENKLEISPEDYLVLSQVESSQQIYDFWKSRLPMCRYCPRVKEVVTWRKSKKRIEEWM